MEQELLDALRLFADELIRAYKTSPNLPVDTGALRNSIRAEVKTTGEVSIIYLRYGVYQDLGVRGYESGDKAPNSPFQYRRDNKPSASHFMEWATKRGRNPYAVAANVAKFGIPARHFITDPSGQPLIPRSALDVLEQSLAAAIETNITTTTGRATS